MIGASIAGGLPPQLLPLILLLTLIFYIGLFYIGCLLSGTPFTPFFKSAGLTALTLLCTCLIIFTFAVLFGLMLVLFYDAEPPQPPGKLGTMFLRMFGAFVYLCVFVVVGGALYNWGLKIDSGQSIAMYQCGIPTGFVCLLTFVGIIGYMTGAIKDDPPPAYVDAGSRPQPVQPTIQGRNSITPPPVEVARPPVEVGRPSVSPTTVSQPERPLFEIPQASPDAAAGRTGAFGTERSSTPTRPLFATPDPAASVPAGDHAAASSPAGLDPGNTASSTGNHQSSDASPFPSSTPQPTVRPRSQSLLGKADWAMEYGQLHTALQHLYAAAAVENDPQVWQNVNWSEHFNRPMFCVMWGVGIEGTLAPGIDPETATAGILPAVRTQLQDLLRRSVFSKHAEALVQDLGIADDRRKLLASARDAGVDALVTVSLQQKAVPGQPRPELTLYVYLQDAATGRSLWRSGGLTRTRYLVALNQGQDLGLELAEEAGLEASKVCGLVSHCPLQADEARTAVRELISSRPANPLQALFLLRYLQRQEKITVAEYGVFQRELVGDDAANVLAGNDHTARQQLIARWLPPLRTPAIRQPAATSGPSPFSGVPTASPGLGAASPDSSSAPVPSGVPGGEPMGANRGGNRFFID